MSILQIFALCLMYACAFVEAVAVQAQSQTCSQTGDPMTNPTGTIGSRFGIGVAVRGDVMMIGASADSHNGFINAGAVYVYYRDGDSWEYGQQLLASDPDDAQLFGMNISIDNGTAIVGSYYGNGAYVFTYANGTWTEQQKLTAQDVQLGDYFGLGVSLDGDTAIVGAYGDDPSGSAYVFVRTNNSWTLQQKLTPPDGGNGGSFGIRTAVVGDTVLIGDATNSPNGLILAGAAYIYGRTNGIWSFKQKLVASDAAATDLFANNLAMDGDQIIVGAHGDDHDAGSEAGAAYVFKRIGETWVEQQKLIPSDSTAGDSFGTGIAIDGTTAVIGSWYDDEGAINSGSAYLFKYSGGAWVQHAKLIASNGGPNAHFGHNAALSGNTTIVGAYAQSGESGAAYVFECSSLPCAADIAPTQGDGVVNAADLLTLISDWGACPGCAADLNVDSVVNAADMLLLIDGWGNCP